MTKEEKQLLIKDLSARLPYEVIALKTYKEGSKTMESTSLIETNDIDMLLGTVEDMEEAHYTIKPYLRPMSSMTKDEYKEYDEFEFVSASHFAHGIEAGELTDWLNAHHFDYRGLIPMGLALEAPEDVYKTE